ncbi:hypothetical protein GN958_ATG18728 [Phytophthora infestans]|uniref:Uncharacterized protein n=1 Tax=Phytophthora infestans TaxID=4787 RepID=A0A8S9U1M2_PHYIN|nr:hypothetical protein GN958_ATG18728 [Phytophthora infestans]
MPTTRSGNGKRRLQRTGLRDEAGSPTDESGNESMGEVASQYKTSGTQNKTRSAQQSNKTTEQAARDEPENGADVAAANAGLLQATTMVAGLQPTANDEQGDRIPAADLATILTAVQRLAATLARAQAAPAAAPAATPVAVRRMPAGGRWFTTI